jgi:hypothetical protein
MTGGWPTPRLPSSSGLRNSHRLPWSSDRGGGGADVPDRQPCTAHGSADASSWKAWPRSSAASTTRTSRTKSPDATPPAHTCTAGSGASWANYSREARTARETNLSRRAGDYLPVHLARCVRADYTRGRSQARSLPGPFTAAWPCESIPADGFYEWTVGADGSFAVGAGKDDPVAAVRWPRSASEMIPEWGQPPHRARRSPMVTSDAARDGSERLSADTSQRRECGCERSCARSRRCVASGMDSSGAPLCGL